MVADQLDYVVGVDPHRDEHAVGVVEVRSGVVVFEASVPADSGGYAEALRLAERHAPGRRAFAVEGTGSYGAGPTRFLSGNGERVFEVGRLRRERRGAGKTDALDAVRAARSVIAQERPATPRNSGGREALRALMAAREGAANAKRAGLCQLGALLVTTPEPLRAELRPLTRARLFALPCCDAARAPHRSRAARHPARAARRRPPRATADRRGASARPRDQIPHRDARATAPRPTRCWAAPRRPGRALAGRTRAGSEAKPRSPGSPASPRSPRPPGKRSATASTAAATASSTEPCTRSSPPAAAHTPPRSPTSSGASARAKHDEKPPAASNATSPGASTGSSRTERQRTLDKHRSITRAADAPVCHPLERRGWWQTDVVARSDQSGSLIAAH